MASQPTSSNNDNRVSRDEINKLVGALQTENAQLKQQLDWFKRQVFGSTSEKQLEPNPYQLSLGEQFKPDENAPDDRPARKYARKIVSPVAACVLMTRYH